MKQVKRITDGFAVSGALTAEDFANVAAQGFKAVISNLPDGESRAHPSSAEAAALAESAGLEYRHLPVTKFELFSDAFVSAMGKALAELPGPILAHCMSGQRSIVAWAAATARHEPVDQVLATLKAVGIDLAPLREELAAQNAGRK
jgi:sulfide:quinone oxidoreductase